VIDILNTISPTYIGQDKIGITVDAVSQPVMVSKIITLNFDYSETLPVGVVKPLKLHVQPAFGSGAGYQEFLFDLFVPNSFAFRVFAAGQYLVLLRELAHNQWQGRLLLDVKGDPFAQVQGAR